MTDKSPDELTKEDVLSLLRQTRTWNEFKLQLRLGPISDEALVKFVISKGVTLRDFRGPAPSDEVIDEIMRRDGAIGELHEPYDRRHRTIQVRDGLDPLHKETYEVYATPEEAEEEWLRLSAEQNKEAWHALAQEMVRMEQTRHANRSLAASPDIVPEPPGDGRAAGRTIRPYVNWGGVDLGKGKKGATTAEIELGEWLDQQAQLGWLPGVGRVRGMPTNKASRKMGESSGRVGDYDFLPAPLTDANLRFGNELRADAIIPKTLPPKERQYQTTDPVKKLNSLMDQVYDKAGEQANVVVIELGGGNSSIVTDEVVHSWTRQDIFGTSPAALKRLIVVRNIAGLRMIVRDVSR